MKLLALAALALAPLRAATISPLFARGYIVLPQPQVARFGPSDFPFTGGWKVERQGVAAGDAAVELLEEEVAKLSPVTPVHAAGVPERLRFVLTANGHKPNGPEADAEWRAFLDRWLKPKPAPPQQTCRRVVLCGAAVLARIAGPDRAGCVVLAGGSGGADSAGPAGGRRVDKA